MKRNTFKYSVIALATSILTSCSSSYLEVLPKGSSLEASYYTNQSEAFAGLVAVYDVMRKNSGGFENMVTMLNAGSDDHVAGGGGATDGVGLQTFSNYTLSPTTVPASYWGDHYQGVFRANFLLSKLPAISMDASLKARYVGEAQALRALYYFNLVRLFKNIPLITSPLPSSEIYNVVQAEPSAIYAQIEKDLNEAIPVLPNTVPAADAGRLTKGAAQALLGKVYLYDKKLSEAAAQLAIVNGTPGGANPYGYKLLSNFADLWVFANKFNSEGILEVAHTSASNAGWGNWGSGTDEGNTVVQMVGPRTLTRPAGSTAPAYYSGGWAFNPITQDLYDALKDDPRFSATILDAKTLKAAKQVNYISAYQDTGYFINKFMPKQADVSTGLGNIELNFRQNSYLIRLADTYLMEAEALGGTGARAQALLDAVRSRVGLPSIPVSLNAIANERRLELACEGHRWFDLVRTGKAATVLASRGFKAGKNEVFPIPFKELENTKIKQNPNY
ncbi:RagB/SusD family nutrient uptake outer membrane protein [Arcicella lustrica]|uniref:RagB/SusD family nutrient uptake outer membrane protein n=1 Tax=Arcicella lustrica TaxID=2984196 RepID=A0ABU5SPE4_9BACT|nr:RagB/SusD family nutrient uptake outer membrane protein [Arcicella sp. DC25W]MEA5429185.1 RagB/SusD family nutrient uptake outer membrane protein [Arcicella sp. DC25W]